MLENKSNSNAKITFGTKYEVKCNETFAYDEGYVYDYDSRSHLLKVAYTWKCDEAVPIEWVRPIATPTDPTWKPKRGDKIECQARAEENDPYGWWDCCVHTVRDNLFLITYEGWDNHHEVVQLSNIRPHNKQSFVNNDGIIRKLYDISKEEISKFKSKSINKVKMVQLKDIANQTQLIHLNFCPTNHKLMLIGTKTQVKDAEVVLNYVFNDNDNECDDRKYNNCDKLQTRLDLLMLKYNDKVNKCYNLEEKVNNLFDEKNELHKKLELYEGNRSCLKTLEMKELDELEERLFDVIRNVQQARKRLIQSEYKCIVCLDNKKNVVLDKCLHMVLCETCEQKLQQKICPMCRLQYETITKIKL